PRPRARRLRHVQKRALTCESDHRRGIRPQNDQVESRRGSRLSDTGLSAKTDALFYLTKEAFKRRLIDDLWRARAATSPKSLAQVLLSDVVTDAVRKELRRQTNHNAEVGEIHRILRSEVLRPETLL
ncbi:hypothetical protein ABGB01_46000, partial [Nonomuraea sp. B5E05]